MWAILMLTIAQPAPPAIRLTLEPGTVCATAATINGKRYRAEAI